MADEQPDESQKTEDPTPRKLEESRRRGQVAVSRELNTWIMLLAGTILIGTMGASVCSNLAAHLRGYIEHADQLPEAPGGLGFVLGDSLIEILGILAMPLIILMVAAFIGPFGQAGPVFAPEVIKPDFSKVSLIAGIERLFSLRALMEFAKGLFKLTLVSLVGYYVLAPYFDGIDHMAGLPMPLMLDELQALIMRLMTGILIALLALAGLDVFYQRREFMNRMRMTKQELKEEYKQSEGDPQVKGRLRQLRAEKARRRMMQAVPTADVVITNPTHYAVALRYDPATMEAPVVVAKGIDTLALRIREIAQQHDIIIYENPPLARTLYSSVDIDQSIPQDLYKAVAEIISYVFRMKKKL